MIFNELYHQTYLFIVVDVFVGHVGEKLFEVLPLVALPALPVRLQVCVETLQSVLALLHLHWHLQRETESYSYRGREGTRCRAALYRTRVTEV